MSLKTEHELFFVKEGFALSFFLKQPLTKPNNQKALVLLHGVGSNETDLFGLANKLPGNLLIISPRGPYTIGTGSYAWYQVEFSTGKPVINEVQEEHSRKILIQFIEQIKVAYNIDKIYLGGFSQGAIMSYSIGLTHPSLVQGLVVLSGRILEEIKSLVHESKELGGLKIFIAHGIQDSTLPVAYARQAQQYLLGLVLQLSYHEYTMGHQVNGEVLKDISEWLEANEDVKIIDQLAKINKPHT
ncbi:MAG: esterase [Bacteroidota bacterium]